MKSNGEDLCAGLVAAPQCQYSKLTGKNLGNSSKHRKTVPPSGHRPIQAQGEGDTCAHSHVGAWLWNLASWPHLLPPPPASAARWLARRGLDGAGRDGLSARCKHTHMCVLLLLACPPGLRGERPGLVHRWNLTSLEGERIRKTPGLPAGCTLPAAPPHSPGAEASGGAGTSAGGKAAPHAWVPGVRASLGQHPALSWVSP